MYVTGIGRTKFGILPDSLELLAYSAILEALEDAELVLDEIDAVYVGNFCGGPTQGQLHMNAMISEILPDFHLPCIRIETACATGGAALYQACMSLLKHQRVLVVGVEKLNIDPLRATSAIAMAGDRNLDQSEGLIFPGSYALIAQQHMLRYGTTEDDLAHVAFKNHQHANKNQRAHFFNTDIDLKTIKESPLVSTPLRLYDCSPFSDGACAVVVSRDKRRARDIKISASALTSGNLSLAGSRDITSFPAVKLAVAEALHQAACNLSDIDVFQVHDCFTIAELIALEDIGVCRPGHAAPMMREGRTRMDGDLPVNTDGGLKADGHPIGATGLAQVFEAVMQLRGEAGERQVANASTALTHNVGGVGGTAAIHILRND